MKANKFGITCEKDALYVIANDYLYSDECFDAAIDFINNSK